jgi:hypothetical protein
VEQLDLIGYTAPLYKRQVIPMYGCALVQKTMKTDVELIQALCLKLRWLCIPLLGSANVYGDNITVVTSTRQPEATLAKKHKGIMYHKCHEAVATSMIRVAHKPTLTNIANLLTKILNTLRRESLIAFFMY